MKSGLISIIGITLVFLVSVDSICACTCGPKPLIIDEISRSKDVFIGKVVGITKVEPDYEHPNGIKSARIEVTRTYIGNLKLGDSIEVANGNGVFCAFTFTEKSIGDQMLIYENVSAAPKMLSYCGRSSHLENASSDLLFLDRLAEVRGNTRVSGELTYEHRGRNSDNRQIVQGRPLRIVGNGKTYSLATDKNGVYEIYGLSPGTYYIQPSIEPGWKINRHSLQYAPTEYSYEFTTAEIRNSRLYFDVRDGGHTKIDLEFSIDNSISGRLVSPEGKPLENFCIYAVETDRSDLKEYGPYGCTDSRGDFVIERLYGSSYILVLNGSGTIEARRPVPTTFYPGVLSREKAKALQVGPGKKTSLGTFRVPKMFPTSSLSGRVVFSDGVPIEDVSVEFSAEVDDRLKPERYIRTKEDGSFSLRIFKGQNGKLRGEKIIRASLLDRCPSLRNSVVQQNAGGSLTIATEWMLIRPDTKLDDIRVVFPVRSCSLD